jgi:hypothetical protein
MDGNNFAVIELPATLLNSGSQLSEGNDLISNSEVTLMILTIFLNFYV